jgi:3'-5' exoribonuclease
MDSKMSSMDQVKKTDNSTGYWSGMIKHLDRVVYKNELPTFTSYQDENVEAPKAPKSEPKDLKQTLGSKLKDFKVD